jgi:hypothetical protein
MLWLQHPLCFGTGKSITHNLLAMQPRQFIVTTDSDHPLEV